MKKIISKVVPLSELQQNQEYDKHLQVIEFFDNDSRLSGYVSLHRKRGPLSIGGTRFFDYRSKSDALNDALRLSRAMTAKCIVSGLPYGGAKAVIIGNPLLIKSKELLSSYANVINELNGTFRTGEDVGMSEDDVQYLLTQSNYFIGKSNVAGDPSPYAALSTFHMIKEISNIHLNKKVSGITVAVKGLGKVGGTLVDLLAKENTNIIVADIDPLAVQRIKEKYPDVAIVAPDEIHSIESDVYAPCAMGNEIHHKNVHEFNTRIICGAANNQLSDTSVEAKLSLRNILFVPDYLANAGGLIDVADELEVNGFSKERVISRIHNLSDILIKSYENSKKHHTTLNNEVDMIVSQSLSTV
jgi:leucine dehydrogenase